MAELFLIRHAQSHNNALGEAHRQSDPALTELGQEQARALVRSLASLPAETCFVSGFRRALETAAPYATTHAAQFHVWRDLHEVGGCYEGRLGETKRPVPGLTPDAIRKEFTWAVPEQEWTDGGWNRLTIHESVEAAIPRVDRVAERLKNQFAAGPGTLLMVSHGEFISLLLARMLGLGRPFFVRPRSIYNTAITHVKLSPNQIELHEFNRVCHLSKSELTS